MFKGQLVIPSSYWASQVVLLVKNPLANAGDTRDAALDQEDALEEEMATHSSIFAWRIPWIEEIGRLQSITLQRVRHDWSDLPCTHARMIQPGGKGIQSNLSSFHLSDSKNSHSNLYFHKILNTQFINTMNIKILIFQNKMF